MYRIFLAVLVLSLALPQAAFADNIETGSEITAVTVYTNRAKIVRRAVVDIPKGAHTVIFKDVPAGMLPESLRAEGSAAADVTIGALAHRKAFKAELVSAREQELQDRLEQLTDQQKGLAADKAALEGEKKFLETLTHQAGLRSGEEIAAINLNPEQWQGAAQTIRTGLGEALKGLVAIEIKNREMNEEIQKVRNELAQLQTGARESWQVAVPVEAAAATRLTLEISYQMYGATWRPLYDARLDTGSGELELVQYGEVQQTTGEDWDGVALTLSTAQPQRAAGLPDLSPLWVDLWEQQVMQRKALSASPQAVMETMAMADMSAEASMAAGYAAAPAQKASFRQAEIETGGYVSNYRIPGPSNIPADGTATKLMVGAFKTENELQIHVKPQLDTSAYLVAHLKLKGDTPVLPGSVNLFRDGAYVGQASLPLLRPDEEADLAFGVDDQIAVQRRVLKDARSEAGLIAKDNTLARHYVTELQNLHSMAVKIMVFETVPVAQNEKIKVEIAKGETTAGYKSDYDNVKGLLLWTATLEPKAKKDVRLGWSVSWPKDSNLSGL